MEDTLQYTWSKGFKKEHDDKLSDAQKPDLSQRSETMSIPDVILESLKSDYNASITKLTDVDNSNMISQLENAVRPLSDVTNLSDSGGSRDETRRSWTNLSHVSTQSAQRLQRYRDQVRSKSWDPKEIRLLHRKSVELMKLLEDEETASRGGELSSGRRTSLRYSSITTLNSVDDFEPRFCTSKTLTFNESNAVTKSSGIIVAIKNPVTVPTRESPRMVQAQSPFEALSFHKSFYDRGDRGANNSQPVSVSVRVGKENSSDEFPRKAIANTSFPGTAPEVVQDSWRCQGKQAGTARSKWNTGTAETDADMLKKISVDREANARRNGAGYLTPLQPRRASSSALIRSSERQSFDSKISLFPVAKPRTSLIKNEVSKHEEPDPIYANHDNFIKKISLSRILARVTSPTPSEEKDLTPPWRKPSTSSTGSAVICHNSAPDPERTNTELLVPVTSNIGASSDQEMNRFREQNTWKTSTARQRKVNAGEMPGSAGIVPSVTHGTVDAGTDERKKWRPLIFNSREVKEVKTETAPAPKQANDKPRYISRTFQASAQPVTSPASPPKPGPVAAKRMSSITKLLVKNDNDSNDIVSSSAERVYSSKSTIRLIWPPPENGYDLSSAGSPNGPEAKTSDQTATYLASKQIQIESADSSPAVIPMTATSGQAPLLSLPLKDPEGMAGVVLSSSGEKEAADLAPSKESLPGATVQSSAQTTFDYGVKNQTISPKAQVTIPSYQVPLSAVTTLSLMDRAATETAQFSSKSVIVSLKREDNGEGMPKVVPPPRKKKVAFKLSNSTASPVSARREDFSSKDSPVVHFGDISGDILWKEGKGTPVNYSVALEEISMQGQNNISRSKKNRTIANENSLEVSNEKSFSSNTTDTNQSRPGSVYEYTQQLQNAEKKVFATVLLDPRLSSNYTSLSPQNSTDAQKPEAPEPVRKLPSSERQMNLFEKTSDFFITSQKLNMPNIRQIKTETSLSEKYSKDSKYNPTTPRLSARSTRLEPENSPETLHWKESNHRQSLGTETLQTQQTGEDTQSVIETLVSSPPRRVERSFRSSQKRLARVSAEVHQEAKDKPRPFVSKAPNDESISLDHPVADNTCTKNLREDNVDKTNTTLEETSEVMLVHLAPKSLPYTASSTSIFQPTQVNAETPLVMAEEVEKKSKTVPLSKVKSRSLSPEKRGLPQFLLGLDTTEDSPVIQSSRDSSRSDVSEAFREILLNRKGTKITSLPDDSIYISPSLNSEYSNIVFPASEPTYSVYGLKDSPSTRTEESWNIYETVSKKQSIRKVGDQSPLINPSPRENQTKSSQPLKVEKRTSSGQTIYEYSTKKKSIPGCPFERSKSLEHQKAAKEDFEFRMRSLPKEASAFEKRFASHQRAYETPKVYSLASLQKETTSPKSPSRTQRKGSMERRSEKLRKTLEGDLKTGIQIEDPKKIEDKVKVDGNDLTTSLETLIALNKNEPDVDERRTSSVSSAVTVKDNRSPKNYLSYVSMMSRPKAKARRKLFSKEEKLKLSERFSQGSSADGWSETSSIVHTSFAVGDSRSDKQSSVFEYVMTKSKVSQPLPIAPPRRKQKKISSAAKSTKSRPSLRSYRSSASLPRSERSNSLRGSQSYTDLKTPPGNGALGTLGQLPTVPSCSSNVGSCAVTGSATSVKTNGGSTPSLLAAHDDFLKSLQQLAGALELSNKKWGVQEHE